eukprot:TRINITY_DN4981_c0_g1_i1.p1 TRINITY_DN4981_c0_g1~~TRINITY_DN4981_c0_g1_i1.p1  ORF type:complete len:108 (-),score=20.16 TRINITY_DN4981_c0_g1_i1:428-751(-)
MSTHKQAPPKQLQLTRVCDIKPFMRNINLVVIVLDKLMTNKTKDGVNITQFIVADSTGSIQLSLWEETGFAVKPSDILQLNGAHSALHKNELKLQIGQQGTVERVGE